MSIGPDFLEAVAERAEDDLVEIALGVSRQIQGDDGETYGEIPIRGAEFLSYYLDLQSRMVPWPPEQTVEGPEGQPVMIPAGPLQEVRVLDHLRVVAPHYAESLDRQFERELARQRDRVA